MSRKIGIIGSTGRMGLLLQEKIAKHPHFVNGPGFSRSQLANTSLMRVFSENDYLIDFSNPELMQSILETALVIPKPLVICTTGWNPESYQELLNQVIRKMPVVLASNTSIGAYLQKQLVQEISKILGSDYDIDILEKHHRYKVDIPSGTARSLIQEIQNVKNTHQSVVYEASMLEKGPRKDNVIGISIQRSGNIPGDHEVTFTSDDEMISIRHVAFSRNLFAQGALRIVEWLDHARPQPGLYTMQDVLKISL